MAQHNVSKESDYGISITGRHFEVTPAVESYVTDKILSVAKMAPRVIDIAVILDAHKLEHSCAITMNLPHYSINVHASTENMYSAIDKCVDKLFALVSKYKSKLQSKHGAPLSAVDFEVNVIKPYSDNLKLINDDIEEVTSLKEAARFQLHEIVAKETVAIKMHTQDEAVMRMEFSNDPFMIYRSEEDQKIKILYRRPDNNYNLVQVQ